MFLLLALVASVSCSAAILPAHLYVSGSCTVLSVTDCNITSTYDPATSGEFDFRNGISGPTAFDPVTGRLYLYVSSRIYYYTPPNMTIILVPTAIPFNSIVNAIAVDSVNRYLYWSESFNLARTPLDATLTFNTSIVATGGSEVGLATSVALDTQGNIYWVDSANRKISRTRTDGSQPTPTLLFSANKSTGSLELITPTGVAVCGGDRLVFSDAGRGEIYAANTDGSSLSTIFSVLEDKNVFSPYSVVCADTQGLAIYWTDADDVYGGLLSGDGASFLVTETPMAGTLNCSTRYLSVNKDMVTSCSVEALASSSSDAEVARNSKAAWETMTISWFIITVAFLLSD